MKLVIKNEIGKKNNRGFFSIKIISAENQENTHKR